MTNELFINNIDETIRLEKLSNGELIVQSNDYANDEFVIQTLSAEQARQLRDWLNANWKGL